MIAHLLHSCLLAVERESEKWHFPDLGIVRVKVQWQG